jgi:AcrR family transcriptional regulator
MSPLPAQRVARRARALARSAGAQTSAHERILEAAKGLFARRGYENTSTVAIARLAGTSESQLMKHFGSKDGVVEAIFNLGWQSILANVRVAITGATAPREKLRRLVDRVLAEIEKDPDLKLLLMLEGRRIRRNLPQILLAPGFLEFVRLLDDVLKQMRAAGELRRDMNIEAVRSAMMGAVEGLIRDRLLGQRMAYPAHYSEKQVRQVIAAMLDSFAAPRSRRR